MIKKFCDACSKETITIKSFDYLCHLDNEPASILGYVDDCGNPTSKRLNHYDLCTKCYNSIMIKAVEQFNKIKEDKG